MVKSTTVLRDTIDQLKRAHLYNQALLTLLEVCCDGIYQNYLFKIKGGVENIDAYVTHRQQHLVLITSENFLTIKKVRGTEMIEETPLEFPSRLCSLTTLPNKEGRLVAFVGSEYGEVWQINATTKGYTIQVIEDTPAAKSKNKISSFTIHRTTLVYSPSGDSTIHLYDLSRRKKRILKKNNYKNVSPIQFLNDTKGEYLALGFTDQEKGFPLLSLYTTREDFIWGVEEIEGSVKTLGVIHHKSGEMLILAGTEKATLYAVDLKGTLRWKFKTDGAVNCMEVSYRPKTKEPYIFLGAEGGTLYLLDASGIIKWHKVFNAAVKDIQLVTFSAYHYPHLLVGLSDSTVRSLSRAPAEGLAPLFTDLFSEILKKEKVPEESLIDYFAKSDYQIIRDYADIRRCGFNNVLSLLILQLVRLGRPLEEIFELLMPYKLSPKSLASLAEFRLHYESRKLTYDFKLRSTFENLYQRGDFRDALVAGCQLVYQGSDLQWITQLAHSADHIVAIDHSRFTTIAENRIHLSDRLIPSKDFTLSLTSKIIACFHTKKIGFPDHLATLIFLTKDYKLSYYSLPLSEITTIDMQAREQLKGEIKEKSVTMLRNLLSFCTTENLCYLYSLSTNKVELIRCFKTNYHITTATFLAQDNISIALGTPEGRILVYTITKGEPGATSGEEPLWSADIEGRVESMVSASNADGEAVLIAGSSSGAVKAFDSKGNLLWEFRTITENLKPGRGVKVIIAVPGQTHSGLTIFIVAGKHIYVVSEEGKLIKMFTLPEETVNCLDLIDGNSEDQPHFVILFSSNRVYHYTFYWKSPLLYELQKIYHALTTTEGEENFIMDLFESESPYLQAFAFQQATHLVKKHRSIKEAIVSSMRTLSQKDAPLRRVIIRSLENVLVEEWNASLLLDTIDCNDIFQFSGMVILLEKVGKRNKASRDKVTAFLKSIYFSTKNDVHHIAILQLLEVLLKDDPLKLVQFLFEVTPFESSHWVSQEIGLILGRSRGKAYVENFNLLSKCFYVSSTHELKALSNYIRNNIPTYQEKLADRAIEALRLFAKIDWDQKERMDEPFKTELVQLKKILNPQSLDIANALFNKWERILKNVSTEKIKLSDLPVGAWHRVENLNSHVRHSIVEGCFSGLESFSLMLKERYNDSDMVATIDNCIKQLPIVRKTLSDYFECSISDEVRLKDIFFVEYKTIFKDLDDIERVSSNFRGKLNTTSYRNTFSEIIPQKTRSIQRKNLAAIDVAVKSLKKDVRTIVENLLTNSFIKHALYHASISVKVNFSELESTQFRVLVREHELYNALYELVHNVIKHAYKDLPTRRAKNITFAAEWYTDENLYLRITISDNGMGMSSTELSRMRDISITKEGTGEGIARVFQLIERNCGRVAYTSEKGKGTTVSLSLPLKIRKDGAKNGPR